MTPEVAREVPRAREVIARPDLHSAAVLREACALLEAHGDWMDHERARQLRLSLEREARARSGVLQRAISNLGTAFAAVSGTLILVSLAWPLIARAGGMLPKP